MPDEGGATTEVIKALKLGMETEKRGLESYLNFARQTKDETGKNMFILLALDELQHFEILERVLTELDISGAWSEIEIKRSLIERVIPKLKERDVRTHGERGIDQVDALHAALEQERRSAELYREQLAKTTDAQARKMFQRLMEMEEFHYELLSAELDSINESGFWFTIPEFNLEVE